MPKGEGFAYGIAMLLAGSNATRLDPAGLFDMMVEILYLAARNGSEPRDAEWRRREERYHAIRRQVGDDAVRACSKVAGSMVAEARRRHGDLFGEISEAMGLNAPEYGRNATPYEASRTMARMTVSDLESSVQRGEIVDIQDPCSGTGGMAVAVHEAVTSLGWDPSRALRLTLADPDPLCWRMTYVACWIYSIPATIVHGDLMAGTRTDEAMSLALSRIVRDAPT